MKTIQQATVRHMQGGVARLAVSSVRSDEVTTKYLHVTSPRRVAVSPRRAAAKCAAERDIVLVMNSSN